MRLPIPPDCDPMLARAVATIPDPPTPGAMQYEPKWDGFRCLVFRDGDEVELISRGTKSLNRYFPEVVAALAGLPPRIVLDCELVVRTGEPGRQRLDWTALSLRVHPAASRIARLAVETPAELIAFDLLAIGDVDCRPLPLRDRRDALADLLDADAGVHLGRATHDPELARVWFTTFEGAGLDGVVAKRTDQAYLPGQRGWWKIKHTRTAEAVVYGYRIHTSGRGVGSILLALYDDAGRLIPVGGASAFSNARRLELVDELAELVLADADGVPLVAETARSRFSAGKDTRFVPLRPERVVEVGFDQLEGQRFRHAVTFVRWRPDRDPLSCRLDQIDRAPAYDLNQVLGPPPPGTETSR